MTDQVDETPVEDHKQGALFAFRRALPVMNPAQYARCRDNAIEAALTAVCKALKESKLGLWSTKADGFYAFALSEMHIGLTSDGYQKNGALVVEAGEGVLRALHKRGSFEARLDYEPGLDLLTVNRVTDTREPHTPKEGRLNVGEVLANIIVTTLTRSE